MKYLLDVNALVALGVEKHLFHERVALWVGTLAEKGIPELATCSITELGFVRVLSQARQYGFTFPDARALLLRLRAATDLNFALIPDNHDLSYLPNWVGHPAQLTDGHLAELAKTNGAVLATLDRKIPGAYLIPDER
jgi:uncharacterized protein